MAASFQQEKVYQIPAANFFAELRSPHFWNTLNFVFRSENPTPGGYWYRFHHGVSMASWGEKLTVTVVALSPTATQVTVHSECGMPTQLIDWGKNKSNVNKVFAHLETCVRANVTPPPPPPYTVVSTAQNPLPAAPVAPVDNVCFCAGCGTRMLKTDRFCGTCGRKNG